jgi:Flp pilus assembly protein TadD
MRRTIWLVSTCVALLAAQQGRDLRIEPASAVNTFSDRGTRWAVVVGVSSYRYLPPGAQLRFAHRDAEEFASFLRSASGGGIPAGNIRLLSNEQSTLAEIRAAMNTWLARSARPQDIVYFFFAGHGVLDDRDEGYFVAHDSDPQNLHATGLPFQEVDQTLSSRVKAGLVVMVADACHTGRLGWSSFSPGSVSRAAEPLARIGQGDRAFLKLLASRPSEQSFEDPSWEGGHGVFTHALLEGLRGEADRDNDRVIRASEAIDYVSRRVPELTNSRQNPRVAGTFDANVAMAFSARPPAATTQSLTLDIFGPSASAIYLDNVFRGRLRSAGTLRVDSLAPGPHAFSADFPDGFTLEGFVTLKAASSKVNIAPPPPSPLAQLRARIATGQVVEPNGAWDFYHKQSFAAHERAAADALMGGALEELGQACVVDYVQSPSSGLKRALLQRAVDAFDRLRALRPNDSGLEVRQLFCRGRLQIAESRFAEAVATLEKSIRLDPRFACSYNALGVALGRINRREESRKAFETAAKLTPEWALPPYQIAAQLVAAGEPAPAIPYLERAVSFNPRSVAARWNLLHVNRLLGRVSQVERQAAELIRLDAGYAPTYLELGLAYDAARNVAKAVEAYDAYVLLAPNYAGTEAVRNRADQLRGR